MISFALKYSKAFIGAVIGFAAFTAPFATVTSAASPDAAAARPEPSSSSAAAAVFQRFQQLLRNPSDLAKARAYAINHIREVDQKQATLMTLHLENAQLAYLPKLKKQLMDDAIQQELSASVLEIEYNLDSMIKMVKNAKTRALLQEVKSKGYQLWSSEGVYYPVMHYSGYKQFRSYVNKDIAVYIDLKAAEYDQPSFSDGALLLPWDQLLERALAYESFAKQYPKSSRAEAIRRHPLFSRIFFGSSNTPVYDYSQETNKTVISPDVRNAYEKAVAKGPKDSELLSKIGRLLTLLDQTNNEFTPEIERFLEQSVNG
ncbi:hypothetical protein [Paenibacillus sp. NPDC058071]|uniref:hypothetical protein n=1 Tax=Paenibacillus sp. NPDC058071 TaxID=3346326 RepID=UPI0036DD9B21